MAFIKHSVAEVKVLGADEEVPSWVAGVLEEQAAKAAAPEVVLIDEEDEKTKAE